MESLFIYLKSVLFNNHTFKIDISSKLALTIIFFLFSIVIFARYQFGISDQYEQLPIIFRVIDPSYLVNDWFTNQNDGFSPRFFYAHFIGFLATFLNPELIFFLLYIFFNLVFIISIFLISKEFFSNNLATIFTIILIIFGPRVSLGGNWIFSSLFLPQTIAISLIFLSFYFILKKNYLLSPILLGIATFFQPILGILIGSISILYLVFLSAESLKIKLIRAVKFTTLYVIIGIFALIPLISNTTNISDLEIFYIIAFFRHPHHYSPFAFPLSNYLAMVFILLLFALIVSLNFIPLNKDYHHFALFVIGMVLLMGIIGTIFVELVPVAIIGKMQLFRVNPFIAVFIYIYAGNFLISVVSKINDLFSELASKINVLFRGKLVPVIILMLLFSSLFILYSTNYHPKPSPNEEMYNWIQNNTPKNAIFLVPPSLEEFRFKAKRAIVIDWKSFPFEDKAVIEWKNRIDDISNGRHDSHSSLPAGQLDEGYYSLKESQILKLKDRYDFQYVITIRDLPGFKVAYLDDEYKIYEI